MSQTQTRTFLPPPADKLPILSCIGIIGNVGETKYKPETGNFVTEMDIEPLQAGKSQRVWVTINPNWIRFSYRPNDRELKAYKRIVHSGNTGDDNLAFLQAIGGNEEGFGELCGELDNLPEFDKDNPDQFGEALNNLFTEFAQNKYNFGYVLRQQTRKNDETGEWERTKWYEVQRYFYPTNKQLEKERKSAEKQSEKIEKYYAELKEGTLDADSDGNLPDVPTAFKVTFDEAVPF